MAAFQLTGLFSYLDRRYIITVMACDTANELKSPLSPMNILYHQPKMPLYCSKHKLCHHNSNLCNVHDFKTFWRTEQINSIVISLEIISKTTGFIVTESDEMSWITKGDKLLMVKDIKNFAEISSQSHIRLDSVALFKTYWGDHLYTSTFSFN